MAKKKSTPEIDYSSYIQKESDSNWIAGIVIALIGILFWLIALSAILASPKPISQEEADKLKGDVSDLEEQVSTLQSDREALTDRVLELEQK